MARIGGFEESFPGMYEDHAFYAKVCLAAPVYVAGECWDRYRQRPDSVCSIAINTGQVRNAHLTYLKWLASYMSEQGFRDVEIWQTLRRELWFYRHPNWLRLRARARYLAKGLRYVRLRLAELPLPTFVRR
jgi:hypothetical protein